MFKLQEFFDKLKLELHLLGLEIDDEFEKIEGKPINITVSGGEDNLRITFGYPGARVQLDKNSLVQFTPEQIALEIYSYMKRKEQMSKPPVGRPYGEPARGTKIEPKLPRIPKQPEEPKRRVFNMGPSQEIVIADCDLTIDEFAARYPEGMGTLRSLAVRIRELGVKINSWRAS